MNIPNLLTAIRILLLPVYLWVFYSGIDHNLFYAALIFIVVGLTDILDGFIARRYNMVTRLGTVLDPLADKLVVFTILISLVHRAIIPKWILYIMALKEAILIVGGTILYLFKKNQIVPSNLYGKLATVLFYITIMAILFSLPNLIINFFLGTMLISNALALINYIVIYRTID